MLQLTLYSHSKIYWRGADGWLWRGADGVVMAWCRWGGYGVVQMGWLWRGADGVVNFCHYYTGCPKKTNNEQL